MTTRISSGTYETTYRGHVIRVVRVDKKDADPGDTYLGQPQSWWHIHIDGDAACDSAPTKRDALEFAARMIDAESEPMAVAGCKAFGSSQHHQPPV